MSNLKNIYFLGYSGHAYVAIEIAQANELNILGYFDKVKAKTNPYELKFIGDETKVDFHKIVGDSYVFPAMGGNSIRKKLVKLIEKNKIKQLVLTAESAAISSKAVIGNSTLIGPKTVINSLVTIGKGCIINSAAVIEHECKIGDFTHIAPSAVLAGNVVIGSNTFIGANAVVKQGIKIGDNVVVGAGGVVIRDIPNNVVWAGNPAVSIHKK